MLDGAPPKSPRRLQNSALDADTVLNAFFEGNDPTNLWNLVDQVDQRLQGFSNLPGHACELLAPVAYDLGVQSWGEQVTLAGQCYQANINDPESEPDPDYYVQFGYQSNATVDLYVHIGTIVAARVQLNALGNVSSLDIWASVITLDRSESDAVMRIHAEPGTTKFEMTVAGVNVGFCGLQMVSDGVSLNVTGSTGSCSCDAVGSLCLDASDLSLNGTTVRAFLLLSASGRRCELTPSRGTTS